MCPTLSKALGCIKEHILFILAWSGCDTTAHCFGFGKQTILNALKENVQIQELAKTIANPNATQADVGEAGVKLFCHLYGQSQAENLTRLRHDKFQKMLSQKNES